MVVEDEGANLSVGQVSSFSAMLEGITLHLLNSYCWELRLTFFVLSYSDPWFHWLGHSLRMRRLSFSMKRQVCLYLAKSFPCQSPSPHLSASVDYETDRKIQDTIAYEFKDRTILCIARTPFFPPSS